MIVKGNLYVADQKNNLIRKITPEGVVTTFAGSGSASSEDGTGTAASLNDPRDLVFDNQGNLFVVTKGVSSDTQNYTGRCCNHFCWEW